jgi:DNA modification methylase
MFGNVQGCYDENGERFAVGFDDRAKGNVGNNHPTVKPIELMKYLIKLITPPGGTVLDPFCGSGSTGCAAVELGHPFIGCELDPKYVEIAQRRIGAWQLHTLFSIED